ncbi:MAG: hypothetical protein Q4C61_10595 [Lachnospiraceae bacterium]|nr:hypothetical protein [Lachnospiraceae bacterium]
MATLYLHIGIPKTGTTALQNFMAQNQEALQQHGICYPDFGYRYPRIGVYRNGHFLIAPYVTEDQKKLNDRPGSEYEEGLDKTAELAKEYDKIILTDEALWKGSQNRPGFWPQLKEDLAKRGLDLRIIVYFRRQDLWIQSFWAQKIKTGSGLTFHEYIASMKENPYPMDYYEYMNMLSGIFGKEALIIRIYEKGQYRGKEKTLVSDFLDIFGLSLDDGFTVEEKIYNTTLTGNPLEMRRLINTLPGSRDQRQILTHHVPKPPRPDTENSTESFSWFRPQEQRAYLEQFAESNSKVAREYLGRDDGILFYDEIEELPQPVIDDSALLRDTICLYGKVILEQQETINKLKKEIKDLREDVLWFRLKRKVRHLMDKDN